MTLFWRLENTFYCWLLSLMSIPQMCLDKFKILHKCISRIKEISNTGAGFPLSILHTKCSWSQFFLPVTWFSVIICLYSVLRRGINEFRQEASRDLDNRRSLVVGCLYLKRLATEFLHMPFSDVPDKRWPEITCFLSLSHKGSKNCVMPWKHAVH